jgi:hypothetical protein
MSAICALLDAFHAGPSDARAEFFRLCLHFHHQLWPHDPFWRAGPVLDFRRGGQLAAWLSAGEQEGF